MGLFGNHRSGAHEWPAGKAVGSANLENVTGQELNQVGIRCQGQLCSGEAFIFRHSEPLAFTWEDSGKEYRCSR